MTPAGDGYPWKERDLNMLDDDAFLHMIRCFGADHVLFGTDSPWADQNTEIRCLLSLPIPSEAKAAVLGGNAAKLMGWEI